MTEGPGRRRFLTAVLSLAAGGSLAGCQGAADGSADTDSDLEPETAGPSGSATSTSASTTTGQTAEQLSVQVDAPVGSDPPRVSLPPVWDDGASVEPYWTTITVSSLGDGIGTLRVVSGDVTVQEVEPEEETEVTVTLTPAQLTQYDNYLRVVGETAEGAEL